MSLKQGDVIISLVMFIIIINMVVNINLDFNVCE